MTNFRCKQCGEEWSEGPTRDMNYLHTCRKCLEISVAQSKDNKAHTLRLKLQEKCDHYQLQALERAKNAALAAVQPYGVRVGAIALTLAASEAPAEMEVPHVGVRTEEP